MSASAIAIVVPGFTGHLNPMLVLARALQRRGHRIVVLSVLDAEAKVRRAGLEFSAIAVPEFGPGEWDRLTARIGTMSGYKASLFAGNWLGRFARGILRDLPGIISRERFDGMVMDQVSVGPENVCAAMGLPLAVASCALSFHMEMGVPPCMFSWPFQSSLSSRVRNLLGYLMANATGGRVLWEVVPFRIRHKLPPMKFHHINELPPSLVQVAQQPAFFDFPRRGLPRKFHYTGPWIDPSAREDSSPGFPWERLDGRPLIYASLGTLQNQLQQVFRIIAEASAGLDAQLVIALGRETTIMPSNLAGDPILAGYAPQLPLLKRASLTICHGGLNTVLESLSEGVPLIALPITHDQPGVAARIRHLGVGEFLRIKTLNSLELRDTIRRLLSTASYRENARRCAVEIRRQDGPELAAELIERAFITRQPVLGENPPPR
jgi:MGT family glycosyltransferase